MGQVEDEHLDTTELIESMKGIIKLVPDQYYADILYDSLAKTGIKKSHSGDIISVPHTRGFVFRIFNGRKFTELADPNILTLKRHVEKLVGSISLFKEIRLDAYDSLTLDKELPMKKDITSIPLQDKIQKIHQIYEIIEGLDDSLVNVILSYQDSLSKRIFLNTEGSVLRQAIPRTRILIQPIVQVAKQRDFDFRLYSHQGGFELLDQVSFEDLSKLVESSKQLCVAKPAPMGEMPVVLDHSLAGLVAHESFGHGVEADQFVRDRSYLIPYFNKKIGPEQVSISDSAVEDGVVGSYIFDDEGILAKKTRLVEQGKLTHLLHNRVTATIRKETPHGNGRRESFLNPVYPRMSNTFFEPGDRNMEEIFENITGGLYLVNGFYGKEDPLGGSIKCSSRKAFLIENGEISEMVKGATISGDFLNFIKHITGVSRSDVEFDGGICGKGIEDHIPITSGGVHLQASRAFISPA